MAGLSQEELAERSGLSVRAIRNLEGDRTRWPYRQTLLRLADALELGEEERADFIEAAARRFGRGAMAEIGEPPLQAPSALPVPRQLPAAVRGFTGRATELTMLNEMFGADGFRTRAAMLVVMICGTAGVGKTALAVHWAQHIAEQFPEGQLFVDLHGFEPSGHPMQASEALRSFVEALGIPAERAPYSLQGLIGLYRSLLANRRMLIVLDNARDAKQVKPLLPGSADCVVVVTSRKQLSGLAAMNGGVQISLGPLEPNEARQMVAQRLGIPDEESVAARQFAESCGGLPLALSIGAARAAIQPDLPLSRAAEILTLARNSLDIFTLSGDPEADIRGAFSWSYQTLSSAGQRMFRLLGLHPGPDISAAAATSVAAVTPGAARMQLSELAESSLLFTPPDRFALHDLLRVYAAELSQRQGSRETSSALIRTLDHYLATATTALGLLEGTPRMPVTAPPRVPGVIPEELATRDRARSWFLREYQVILRLIDAAYKAGLNVYAWQLPRVLCCIFGWRARWDDWDHTHQIAVDAAERLDDIQAQAITHMNWSRCDSFRGNIPEAERHLQVAYRLFGKLGDRNGQARVLTHLGVAASRAGQYHQATNRAHRALKLFTETADLDGQAGAMVNIGLYRVRLGQHAAAVRILTQAEMLFLELDNAYGQALAAHHLGLAFRDQGRYSDSIRRLIAAVDLYRGMGAFADQAEVLSDLAESYIAADQRDYAADAYQDAAAILTELGHPGAAKARANLAVVRAQTLPADGDHRILRVGYRNVG